MVATDEEMAREILSQGRDMAYHSLVRADCYTHVCYSQPAKIMKGADKLSRDMTAEVRTEVRAIANNSKLLQSTIAESNHAVVSTVRSRSGE